MLEDRDYMRADYEPTPATGFRAGGRFSVTIWLIILNVVVFALQAIMPLATAGPGRPPLRLETWFALHPLDLLHGAVWQLLTYQFLHGGLMHILVNCLMLYWFGNTLERNFGGRRMLVLYLTSGVVGGLVQTGLSLLFPARFGFIPGYGFPPVVGASAGVFGLVATFAVLFRNMPITMLVAFIFPVAMKAKYLLIIEVAVAVLGLLMATDNIAHGAHLGGMLVGVLYALYVERGANLLPRRKAPPETRIRSLEMVGTPAKQRRGGGLVVRTAPDDLSKDEFLSQEVDPILDKISAHGIQSLTEREKRVLEAAKRKMQQG
jgi:membrane associated rhomboid family serine protease